MIEHSFTIKKPFKNENGEHIWDILYKKGKML